MHRKFRLCCIYCVCQVFLMCMYCIKVLTFFFFFYSVGHIQKRVKESGQASYEKKSDKAQARTEDTGQKSTQNPTKETEKSICLKSVCK